MIGDDIAVAPDVVVPFAAEATGSIYFPRVTFNDEESIAFVSGTAIEGPAWPWWSRHEPDVMLGTLIGLLFVAVVSIWRVCSRPRVRGRWYCRTCNYDLGTGTRIDHDRIAAVCPECGRSTGQNDAIPGRSSFRRLAPVCMFVGVAAPLVCWRLASGVVPAKAGVEPWPHPHLQAIWPGWPLARRLIVHRSFERVRRVDLASGRETGRIGSDFIPGRPTPRSDRWCWIRSNRTQPLRSELRIANFGSSRLIRIPIRHEDHRLAELVGFTGDEREAVVVVHGAPAPTGDSADGIRVLPATTRVTLLGVDLNTQAVREIGSATVRASAIGPKQWGIPTVAAAAEGGDGAWAMFVMSGPDEGTLTWKGMPPRRIENPPVMISGSTRGFRYSLERDAFVMRRDSSMLGANGMEIGRDGDVRPIVPRFAQADVLETRREGLRLLNHGPARILDARPPSWFGIGNPNTSPRERWLYSTSWNNLQGAGGLGEVRMWNLDLLVRASSIR